MAKRTWSEDTAKQRISARIAEVATVTIKEYVRTTDLTGLANGVAYRVDGVHLYVDILNIGDMLNVTAFEGETSHRRTLRFLNLHYRAVRDILLDVDAIEVDFHNQRLHAVFAKPYGDEKARILAGEEHGNARDIPFRVAHPPHWVGRIGRCRHFGRTFLEAAIGC